MKKTYEAPSAKSIAFETEEIMDISYTGNGTALEEKNPADKKPASEFGNVTLF